MRAALLSLMGELAERDGVIARQGQEAVFKQAQIDSGGATSSFVGNCRTRLRRMRVKHELRRSADQTRVYPPAHN